MWSMGGEWCALPTVVEDYHGTVNLPSTYEYGNLFGIHVPDGMPEYESMWICSQHRLEFLKLNSKGNLGTTIWQMDRDGKGEDVTYVQLHEVSVRIKTDLDGEVLSALIKNILTQEMRHNKDLDAWSYLKVVTLLPWTTPRTLKSSSTMATASQSSSHHATTQARQAMRLQ